ncbi:uncharacterized protein OCT59_016002 [Rhizophagus irregularis]|uniref:F-box domain-containing protein n=3 Tax=Rhizophagus irregularis TaxID=588596 RepID=A0A015LAZ5_RHIIW|nr:hypothetical protein GLOIN_2v1783341 [Rhizophagus irregularis DAOM 181602=DAOM 197198]EXX76889.1 hypothetical protein RirG_028840 [Rhizophagus irregularis DAOM 197198w]POG64084.1 hypothetical protein GLOIN_2v1783341 [Rhizophagus irregularis DAOM 181602=DAOM 197198]UZO23671.1 hypothetical protein OCT59_016002 [Rhizophagus irregularis]|eukprot:XP_025170950.1 hypothetical protein GLOIN_2v1783341 [Rhizophagus irregularis DAOM 181602=DAOM 197198]
MSKLNNDIFCLIFEELRDDEKTLYSCLSINKEFCEIIIPILWKNPWKFLKKGKERLLLNVIISHLSKESKNNLNQNNIFINSYQRPLFNYINFCKHLNLSGIQNIIYNIYEESKIKIIENEIIKLFVNENTKFTHLYLPYQVNFQIHLIPGAESCLSEIKFLRCNASVENYILDGLTEICKSIKELEVLFEKNNNYGIVNLIKNQKNLFNVCLFDFYKRHESFNNIIENSLIKHANTMQYFKITKPPVINLLSSFVNLRVLELELNGDYRDYNYLKNVTLPFLQVLKTRFVPTSILISLIENTSGSLIDISMKSSTSNNVTNNKKIIQTIYQKCQNLMYLKLVLRNSSISELEELLIRCQYLDELYLFDYDGIDLNNLFRILTRSSPTNLFKFKFSFSQIDLDSLELFFENWKGRHPMILQFVRQTEDIEVLIEKYKSEGVIKNYNSDLVL